MKVIDRSLVGSVHGELTVIDIRREHHHGKQLLMAICRCSCGVQTSVYKHNLKRTRSCGCLRLRLLSIRAATHGDTRNKRVTKEYNAWSDMKRRCSNPKNSRYSTYGERGITVCDRWLNSFENFLADVGRAPSKDHSIDRIDNDKNYEPGNVKWSDDLEQARNRTNNRRIEYHGRLLTLAEICRETDMLHPTVIKRLSRGMDIYEATSHIGTKRGESRNGNSSKDTSGCK